jgi:hypothetical protein
LISDLDVAFKCIQAKNIKLNPEKCIFGVPQGMLLGFIVSERGIKANPEKITAITKMGPIRDLKGVQRVTGCLAALSRFISCLGKKALSLYRLLKKLEHFSWTPSTSSRNSAMWLCYTLLGISKVSDATTTSTSTDGTLVLVTWCYGEARTIRDDTILRHRGKGHTSSRKC